MAKSLLDQQTQIRGTSTFETTMYSSYAEQVGRHYDSGTMSTTSGSAIMNGSGFSDNFEKDEVGNFIVIDTGAAAGVYLITAVNSTTQVTVSPVATATDASATSRVHYHTNLEDDLNYIRYQLDAVIGEANWYDDPASSINELSSEITSVSGSLAAAITAGDSSTLVSAMSYTDSEVSTLSGTLQSAIDAQDTFIELEDTPGSYSDTKLVMSTAGAIEYTSDLSWNDSTNALTITSGTFGFSDKGTTINEISTDTSLAGASDDAVPTEAAVKSYVDSGNTALDFYKTISDGTASFDADGNDDTLTFNGAGGIIVSAASGTQTVTISGASDFIGLTDTPASYISSNAGYMLRVNDTYDGVDFASTIITDGSGNTTIYGDLSVSGTVFYVDHETVQVSDNMITVNYGEVGVGVTNIYGGIEVDRGTLENYWFVFDETDDWFKIGTSGTLQPVATRGAALTDTYIPFGDSDSSYTESSDFTYNDSTKALDINGSIILSAGTSVNEFSTDTTLSGNSDNAVPTEKAVKTYIDTEDASVYSSATSYADGAASSALSSAQSYADGVGTSTLSSANSYTDTEISTLSGTLQTAIDAQDTFIEMTDTPDAYDDTKLVMSTGAAIVYTSDLTWNDSTNALTITSGTFGFSDAGTTVNEISTDVTMAGDSNDAIATEHAIKTYVDTVTSSISGTVGSLTFLSLTDTPAVYTASRLLYTTTTSGVAFSDGITWDESTDAMVVNGTLGMATGTTVNEFSTDTTLSGNSDDALPTEKAVKTYVDAGDSSTLSSAESYADGVGTSTLSSAESYADGVGTASNSYTDTQLALQDTFIEMNDTPSAYVAQQMLFTSASGVEFASELTWTGSLMTISGSLSVLTQLTLASGTAADEISTDITLADNSSTALVTESAVKGYVDAEVTGQQSYNVNLTISGSVWQYNGGFTTMPDNLVVYLNGVRNKSNDADYYSSTVEGGILKVTFAYDTFDSDWVTATYGGVQGGIYVSRWQTKTDDYQSASADRIMVDTSATGSNGVPYTITLPANPTLGDVVYIFDAGGDCATTNVVVGRNGSNIMGSAADMDIDVDEASVELVYYNASLGWRLV